MDTLVALGSTTAFAYSVWGLLAGWHQHLYFMDAAAILTLVSVGHFLEGKASAQAASSLKQLFKLAPETARRLASDGTEQIVPVADLEIGDVVALKPGDRIPTDAEVIHGASSVTESMLTGESLPIDKRAGDTVYAGTINENGQLQARVTATGEATALAHIIEVVQRAQSSRANIQRLGDRVSSIFVPIVVFIALSAALWLGFGSGIGECGAQLVKAISLERALPGYADFRGGVPCGSGADHCLSLCDGIGDTDRDYGGDQCRAPDEVF